MTPVQSIHDILSPFELTEQDIARVAEEARYDAIDCGKQGVTKQLPTATWNLLDDISDKLWYSKTGILTKISLGFRLFELFPSYYHYLVPYYHAILNKEISSVAEKEMIWEKLSYYLGAADYYAHPVGYVLWVDFFEDKETVSESWQGLAGKCKGKAMKNLLEAAGPVPYDLKEPVYRSALRNMDMHNSILLSLLFSATDLYGDIEKSKAARLLAQLKVDKSSDDYQLLKTKLK